MNVNLKVLREFEFITCNSEYADGSVSNIHYISQEKFKELDAFVRIQNDNDEDENSDSLDFFKAYTKKGIGDVIQAKNYVGLVQLESGFQVQILPKIDMVDEMDEEHSTQHIFIDMLRSMKDFPGKVFSSANLRTESMNLYEIFINMYVLQVSQLTRRGLKSSYVRQEDNLNVFKGKLIVNEHIKRNIAHDERFYVAFDEYNLNRPENRIIKATLLKLQKISSSLSNVKAIRQQLLFFELVEPSTNYSKDFSQVVIDRNTKNYKELMAWSKVFLMNKSFSTFSGDNKARALLFPMEKVYEAFVAKNMEYLFSEKKYDVSSQDTGKYLFKEDKRNVFSLRPDIVVTDENGNTIIMDTKWKRLYDNPEKNYGISQADMYQMFAYSKKYKTKDIWLLYPVVDSLKDHAPISFCDGEETTVNLFFVNVAKIEDSLKELLEKVKVQFYKLENNTCNNKCCSGGNTP